MANRGNITADSGVFQIVHVTQLLPIGDQIMKEKNIDDGKAEKMQRNGAMEIQEEHDVSYICATNEVEIEEVAIDGICGVY